MILTVLFKHADYDIEIASNSGNVPIWIPEKGDQVDFNDDNESKTSFTVVSRKFILSRNRTLVIIYVR